MKYASFIFDFDSTVVDCETLDLVSEVALSGRADAAEVVAEVKRITALGMEGAIPFDESLARRMALIAPTRAAVADIASRMKEHITPSFLAHKDFFAAHRESVYIISGGFDEIIAPVAETLGIDTAHIFANAFVYGTDGVASGVDLSRPSAHAGGKVKAVASADMPHPRVIVGDGWTDYEIQQQGAADAFIAYVEHARRDTVVAEADAVARSFDELLVLFEG